MHTKENVIFEDDLVYMFKDIAPKADKHYLIIPKAHIRDSSHIRCDNDMIMVEHMMKMARQYVKEEHKDFNI